MVVAALTIGANTTSYIRGRIDALHGQVELNSNAREVAIERFRQIERQLAESTEFRKETRKFIAEQREFVAEQRALGREVLRKIETMRTGE